LGAAPKKLKRSQRWRLIQAMIELSVKAGYQEVSIAQLCAGAGVSTVTFYEQFADKEEVLVSAYRACAEGMFDPMRSALLQGETAEVPRLALGAMLAAVAEDPDAGRIVFIEALGAGERMRSERRHAFERFERRVGQYIASLPEDSATLDIPVSAVAGALRHIVSRHLRTHAEDQLPSLLEDGLAWLSSAATSAALTELAYQRFPPCPVATSSAFRASAISRSVRPCARSTTIRSRTSSGKLRGRPRRTPVARFSAKALRVRSPIRLRSSCANVAIIVASASPTGVDKSTGQSSAIRAHFCFWASCMIEAKSSNERLSRSIFATTSAPASPLASACLAASSPGRLAFLPLACSSINLTSAALQPRRSASARIARR
jgi:AcrR family transcriptional regulator